MIKLDYARDYVGREYTNQSVHLNDQSLTFLQFLLKK